MKSSLKDILIKSIEIENEGNKYICKIQIIKGILNVSIYINNTIYEGNIKLNNIQNQIEVFNDYNIDEIFKEINILNKNNFKLIKENNNKYKLIIKFIILRRKKNLYIDLYNNDNIDKNNLNKQNNNLYNNFNIKLKEPIHTLNNHKGDIRGLSILKDGRIVSGSEDKSIIIYNKITYQPDLIINEHNDKISYITTLSSGILASCSKDKKIKLFSIKDNQYKILQTLNYHTDLVLKLIELKNKSLISCSEDN